MAESTPPTSQGPSSKERKYDRQLRLWGSNGQAALESSHVLLINSGAGVVGVETLKNLVLPSLGQFTILDPALVTEKDLGVNFFLENDDLGQSRAKSCSHWLQELNPDVQSHYISEHLEAFLSSQDALLPYTLVLATLPIDPQVLSNLSRWAQNLAIPVFYLHSVGFYSHFTVQLPDSFPIVDTHPDPSTMMDLRLLEPWPELVEFVADMTAGMEQMDDEQHGHIPYAVLLLRALQEWRSTHDGQPPTSYREKSDFRAVVKQSARIDNAEGGEENFDEAAAAVLKSLNPALPSSALKEVFSAAECRHLSQDSASFWLLAHAIQEFFEEHGVLPVSGALPDMKAKSADYIKLQNVYKSKARRDVAAVMNRVRSLEQSLEKTKPIEQAEVEAFCKCAGYVKLLRGRAPHLARASSTTPWMDRASFAVNALQDADSLILIYIAFLTYDSFVTSGPSNSAGSIFDPENADRDSERMADIGCSLVDRLVKEAGASQADSEYDTVKERLSEIVSELVRAGGGELHNIAALTGGIVAQEVIKVLTKQYIPIDNTCVFDGVLSKTSVLRL